MTNIIDVPGIGPVYAGKLSVAGIETIEDLVKEGGSKAGRRKIGDASGIDVGLILEWVNRADLMRVRNGGGRSIDELQDRRSSTQLTKAEEAALISHAEAVRDALHDSSKAVAMNRAAASVAVSITLPIREALALRDMAATRQISLSELIQEALAAFAQSRDAPPTAPNTATQRPRATRSSGAEDAARTQSARLAT